MTQREKNITKEAFEEAQKESRDKQKDEIKKIIIKTLDTLDNKKKSRHELDDEIRILSRDIEDFKEGRLDRVEERQQKDPKAKNVSVVTVIKEIHHYQDYPNWWYVPYRFTWNTVYCENPIYTGTLDTTTISSSNNFTINSNYTTSGTITCSSAKDFTEGTYMLNNGITKYV